ncbi:hypothetical protein PAMP_002622 [Pampus punctatissimus]
MPVQTGATKHHNSLVVLPCRSTCERCYDSEVHAGIFVPEQVPSIKDIKRKAAKKATEGMNGYRRVHSDLVPQASSDGRRSSGKTPNVKLSPYRLPPGTSW